MPKFLHVGCGFKRKAQTTKGFNTPEWEEIRLDIDESVQPDIIGSMTDMKAITDQSVDAIYSSHNIEHLYAYEVPIALGEFLRVLKPQGLAVITCPDLQSVCALVCSFYGDLCHATRTFGSLKGEVLDQGCSDNLLITIMQRILEPEVMDSPEEAIEYDAMDFTEINTAFAKEAIALAPVKVTVLDAGTGTARIPIIISQLRPQWQITAIDMADSMLEIAQKNILDANCQEQIKLEKVDAKTLPYPPQKFDLVISNSLIHHLSDPLPFLQEIKRVLKPDASLFLRDLFRPDSEARIESMVKEIDPNFSPRQAQLFKDSLHAAFTLAEIEDLIKRSGLENVKIYQSSERHWTAVRASKN